MNALSKRDSMFDYYCFDNFRYDVMYVYLYDYAESGLKFKSSNATLLLSMIGILNTIGEVLVGKN